MSTWENEGLFIPNRQLSMVVAGLLFLSFCIFMTGYFLGKRYAAEQFMQKIQTEALDDKQHVALLSTDPSILFTRVKNSGRTEEEEAKVDIAPDLSSSLSADLSVVALAKSEVLTKAETVTHQESIMTINQDIPTDTQENDKRYYAQLIGFGTEKAAEQFVKKLASKGITTEIKKRTSKTAKGKTSYWYQVVTNSYAHKDELSGVVDKLVKEEKLKDVCIRTC